MESKHSVGIFAKLDTSVYYLSLSCYRAIIEMCVLALCVGEDKFTHIVDTWFCQTDVTSTLAAR